MMEEDQTMNQLHDSLSLFEQLVSNQALTEVPLVLLLNKRDILERKIEYRPLSICFPKLKGMFLSKF
jgi:hypothetical protein